MLDLSTHISVVAGSAAWVWAAAVGAFVVFVGTTVAVALFSSDVDRRQQAIRVLRLLLAAGKRR